MDPKQARTQLGNFFSTGETQTFKKRQVILSFKEPIPHAYWVQQGYVKVVTYNSKGDERLNYVYGPGEIFPIAGLFDHNVEPQKFQAIGKVTVRVRTAKDFKQHLHEQPELLVAIVDQMASFINRIYCLNLAPAEQRVICALALFGERFGTPEEKHKVMNLSLTRQEFGDMLRLTRESAGQKLAELEDTHAIILGGNQIRVYPKKLEELMDT